MQARTLRVFAVVFVAACSAGEVTKPNDPLIAPPSTQISDGSKAGGNPDFWFLPPTVKNPAGNPLYLDHPVNPNLFPTIEIRNAANAVIVSEREVQAFFGGGITYWLFNWMVPLSPDGIYRVTIRPALGATTVLGFADVYTSANNQDLKTVNTNLFIPIQDGRTLPIKFTIEAFALCAIPGQGPCTTEAVPFSTGGDVTVQVPGTTGQSGVKVNQNSNSTKKPVITVEPCEDANGVPYSLNPLVTDLPVFGPCLSVKSDPPVSPTDLANKAEVFICDITPFIPSGMPHSQVHRITLHRYDAPNTLTALPHTSGCGTTFSAASSVKGFFANLVRGNLKAAGKQLAGALSPRPLHASIMLDVGAGGITDDFSDFQFALPSYLEIVAGDNQVGLAGQALPINPKVVVKDVQGFPVAGARVRFDVSKTACLAQSAGSGTNSSGAVGPDSGTVTDGPWTIALGNNTRVACGRGLAGDDPDNGPRAGTDPFQPLSTTFGDASTSTVGELVGAGAVTFDAIGLNPLRISGFAEPRNRAPFIDAAGNAPTGALGSSTIVNALNNPANVGATGVVACLLDKKPFVQTIAPGSLVSGGNRLVDVFFAGLTDVNLTNSEAGELAAFVNAGGILYISGNSGANEGPSYHPLFTALGAATTYSDDNSIVNTSGQSSDPPDTTPFTNGPFGAIGPLDHSLFRGIQPGNLMIGLATGQSSAEYILAEGAFNLGRLSAMGDPLYMNQFTNVNPNNLNYFLNLFAAGCVEPPGF